MKLLNLDLLAYGPFTGRHLDLASTDTQFHIVFGGNEAGKSSALRAVLALLYGVPERTTDTFRHDSTKLRVGGHVQHSNGQELAFRRRKGRKKTLLDTNDSPIDDAALAAFLAGVDGTRFEAVFGIDHERLARGAQAILSGGGDVGESLFAAGVGTASLREVLEHLDAEADELYRPRGSKPTINATLTAYRETTKKVRELTLLGSGWTAQRRMLRKMQDQQTSIALEQRALETRATRLDRLHKVLPKLARRRELLADLEPLGDVVLLAVDFTDRRRTAEETLRQARKTWEDAGRELATVQERVGRLEVPQGLLDEALEVNGLHKDLGSFRKAEADATKLEARRAQSRADAHVLLDALRTEVKLDDVDAIRPKTSTKARVRELAEKFQAVEAAPTHAQREVKRRERDLESAQHALADLDAPRDVAPLRGVVARLHKRGDVEEARKEAASELSRLEQQAALALQGLGLWTGTLDEAEKLAMPTLETIDRFQEAFRAGESRIAAGAVALAKCRGSLADQEETLKALQISGDVPTEAHLEAARQRRTEGWLLVRRAWLHHEDVDAPARLFDAESDLPTAYENSVEGSDDVADRLRREADRVARYAEIEAHRVRLQGELEDQQREAEKAAEVAKTLLADWNGVWSPLGIAPLPPLEMRAWVSRHDKLVTLAKGVREVARRVQTLDDDITALRRELSAALEALGEPSLADANPLEACGDRAQLVIDSVANTARRRRDLEASIPKLQAALEDARDVEADATKALETWKHEWSGVVAELGLGSSASPAEANAVLDKLMELFEKVDEARSYQGRLKGIQRDAQAFKDRVAPLVQRAAADLEGHPTDRAVEVLHERLAAAKQGAATRSELQVRIEVLGATIEDSRRHEEGARADLQALCSEASCPSPDALGVAEQRSDHKRELNRRVLELEEQIAELGGGATVEALVSEAEAIDPDTLPADIDEIARQLSVLDGRRTALDQEIGSERAEFDRLDGSDKAAEEAAHAQGLLAKLGSDVERYVRVRLAAELLRREIERYRETNQGPVLTRAGQIFAALTLGSFCDLRADFGDKDEPVLVGVRPSEERVGVQGMSDGTADQLYLAIRLATLEQYLAVHEPLPFVVDDILVHFDDKRALAALEVLAELSRKTQVLFFTHHARLVELARQLGAGRVAVHEL